MEVLQISVDGAVLRIICSGAFGVGSEGNPSGHLIKNALEEALTKHAGTLTEVVVDFSDVAYKWGDGPAWSVMPAVQQGLRVRFVASTANKQALAELLSATGFDRWVRVELDADT